MRRAARHSRPPLFWQCSRSESHAADGPREAALSPEAERATFQLADENLTVELVASEPDVISPVAVSWDADGRMFVAEMIDYPLGPTAGRIRLLEDRDGDGRTKPPSVRQWFAFPNSVLAGAAGCSSPPRPTSCSQDTDGDGAADERRGGVHRVWRRQSAIARQRADVGARQLDLRRQRPKRRQVRRPDEPETAGLDRGHDFRFLPDGTCFEATTGPSQFGQARDDWGERFLSWNTIVIRQALFDQAFLDRNPRLSGFGVRDMAEPAETRRMFPISPRPQTFSRERTDYYNALCGLTIYRGDRLGADLRRQRVRRRIADQPRASTRSSPRTDRRSSRSARKRSASFWPRATLVSPGLYGHGPRRCLYMVDFYRRWVEHPAFVAEKLRGGVDWRQGIGHGAFRA